MSLFGERFEQMPSTVAAHDIIQRFQRYIYNSTCTCLSLLPVSLCVTIDSVAITEMHVHVQDAYSIE